MSQIIDLREDQARQFIDAETVYLEMLRTRREAAEVRGSMLWREVKGKEYLIRTSASGGQTCLGPKSVQTVAIFDGFMARKAACEGRLAELKAAAQVQQRLNKALRVGRVPDLVVRVLNAIDDLGLATHFTTVGTHALYAYESAAGVRFMPDAMATQDIDLLFDTRKRIGFVTQMRRLDTSFIGALRKADPTFRVKSDQLQTAINASGFEVDVIRRVAREDDPHPLRLSDHEDDLWAVQVETGNKILSAQRFSQVVMSVTGRMAVMHTMHPLAFIEVKRHISTHPGRDPRKRRKDALQAELVEQLLHSHLPQYLPENR